MYIELKNKQNHLVLEKKEWKRFIQSFKLFFFSFFNIHAKEGINRGQTQTIVKNGALSVPVRL